MAAVGGVMATGVSAGGSKRRSWYRWRKRRWGLAQLNSR